MLSYKYEELENILDKATWLELPQVSEHIDTHPSESGMDTEGDFNLSDWIDDLYMNYEEGAKVLCH